MEELVTQEETLCTCFPVQCELYRGNRLARKTEEGQKEVESILKELEFAEADKDAARKVAELMDEYPEIKNFDLIIAGICVAKDIEIITKDEDFQRIEEINAQMIQ